MTDHAGAFARAKLDAIRGHAKRAVMSIAVVSAVLNILLLSGSLYMLLVYDMVLPSGSVPTLFGIALMLLVAYAFQGVLDFIRARLLIHFAAAVDVDLARETHSMIRLLSRTQARADSLQPMRDLDQVRSFLSGMGPTALVDLPWILFFMVILFLLHPYLGLTVLVGGLILIYLTYLTEKMTSPRAQQLSTFNARRMVEADTARRHAEPLRAMGMESRMADRWVKAGEQFLGAQEQLSSVSATLSNITKVMRMVLQSAILTVGALLVIAGEATGGIIIASSILGSRALAPVESAIANWRSFVSARQSWTRLRDLLLATPDDETVDILPRPSQLLAVEEATLGPPGTDLRTVEGVSFSVRAGHAVAVLGASGSGKSTLVRALTNIWPLESGAVRLDGAELDQWPPDTLGRHVGYLPQNVELIGGTVAANIARFDPQATPEKIIAAARLAGVHDLILRLPDGYNSDVGTDGRALSGGQRQRIALARALYDDPFMIVLDEPNSNLDTEGEEALAKAVRHVCDRGGIVILVAHRPSILAAVDNVLLMRDGQAVAYGPKQKIVPQLLPRATPAQAGAAAG